MDFYPIETRPSGHHIQFSISFLTWIFTQNKSESFHFLFDAYLEMSVLGNGESSWDIIVRVRPHDENKGPSVVAVKDESILCVEENDKTFEYEFW